MVHKIARKQFDNLDCIFLKISCDSENFVGNIVAWTYKDALHELNMESLEKRREILCLRFTKNCLKNEEVNILFPLKTLIIKWQKEKKNKLGLSRAMPSSDSAIQLNKIALV